MATFVEMIEAAESRVIEYRLIADNEKEGRVFFEDDADRLLAAVLAVESRIEWLGLMLAPLFSGQPQVQVPVSPLHGEQTLDMP